MNEHFLLLDEFVLFLLHQILVCLQLIRSATAKNQQLRYAAFHCCGVLDIDFGRLSH